MSDAYHWPGSGNFGNMSDTNPYGNLAGHQDLWYPVYNDVNAYCYSRGALKGNN